MLLKRESYSGVTFSQYREPVVFGKSDRSFRGPVFCALDIGSSHIGCIIGQSEEYANTSDSISIIGISCHKCYGFSGGKVVDIVELTDSIKKAVSEAEEMAGVRVRHVFLHAAFEHILSRIFTVQKTLTHHNQIITHYDVGELLYSVNTHAESLEKQVVINLLPLYYMLDDVKIVPNPIGCTAEKVGICAHAVAIRESVFFNVKKCLARCHLNIFDIILSPYASSFLCFDQLDENFIEDGIMIVDMGASITSFGFFINGHMAYVASVPLGGAHVTKDIAYAFCLSFDEAESVKILYDSGYKKFSSQEQIGKSVSNTIIEDRKKSHFISMDMNTQNISFIINSRVQDIVDHVYNKAVQHPFFCRLGHRIFLTGGACQLAPATALFQKKFSKKDVSKDVSVITNPDFSECPELDTPIVSSMIGVLMFADQILRHTHSQEKGFKKSFIEKLLF